jgi:hypothetical protein
MTTRSEATQAACPLDRKVRHELDVFRHATDIKARNGECEGECDEHYGDVKTVRVFHKDSGTDWGYFSYCEAARKEDTENRGMELEVPNA